MFGSGILSRWQLSEPRDGLGPAGRMLELRGISTISSATMCS